VNVQAREILIVDDEVGIRELLSEILQDEGYHVAVAENAGEARAYRSRHQPALVLLDIWMPDADGVTLLREWGASGQLTMPVVMMSGHGTIETAVEATKIGAFDFPRKADRPVEAARHDLARAEERGGAGAAAHLARGLGASAPVRDAERALEALRRGAQARSHPRRAGHGTRRRGARARAARRAVRRAADGARLTANPAVADRGGARRRAVSAGDRRSTQARAEGLAFLLSQARPLNVTLVATSAEPLGNLAVDGTLRPALLAQLAPGAVILPAACRQSARGHSAAHRRPHVAATRATARAIRCSPRCRPRR
jgi:CheY-like chemotaxis protein